MSNQDYFELIRPLSLPTKEQCINFARHVCDRHDWYKHISITKGTTFIFFLSPYSGKQPARPSILLSASRYQKEFGFLEYIYKQPTLKTHTWNWDSACSKISVNGMVKMLPPEVMTNCSCILYPYVSKYMNAPGACYSVSHQKDRFTKLESSQHPHRELVLAWKESVESAPERLSKFEKELGYSKQLCKDLEYKFLSSLIGSNGSFLDKKDRNVKFEPELQLYYEAFCQEYDLYMDLQKIEYQKILKCLENLHHYLQSTK